MFNKSVYDNKNNRNEEVMIRKLSKKDRFLFRIRMYWDAFVFIIVSPIVFIMELISSRRKQKILNDLNEREERQIN